MDLPTLKFLWGLDRAGFQILNTLFRLGISLYVLSISIDGPYGPVYRYTVRTISYRFSF